MLRFLGYLVGLALLAVIGISVGGLYTLWRFGQDLPDYYQLADYEPPVMTRVHAGDGRLLTEYAREHRLFVPVEVIPRHVVDAFLSAEDKNFYSHPGVDFAGIIRAAITNLQNMQGDRRLVGASTITQQVAKNFLLTSEVSIERKLREALLAFRIERAFEKNRILELYLNEIYLGQSSYGVAAAALNYFDKPLDDLTLAEAAYLAALPKAPNNYHPVRNYQRALTRRNWVLSRMVEDGHISAQEAEEAQAQPLTARRRSDLEFVTADYFTEDVRRELVERFGEDALYDGGLSVRTTLEPALQRLARAALRAGLVAYDQRYGYAGPILRIEPDDGWVDRLAAVPEPEGLSPWYLAVVLEAGEREARIGFAPDGQTATIDLAGVEWARKRLRKRYLGPRVTRVDQVLNAGDVVAVEPVEKGGDGQSRWQLRQIPDVNGAIVALDPHTGRVLALVGGFSFGGSEFNRATQAKRQPGSAFKPFVYGAALEAGFTPSTLVLDAPFVINQGQGLGKWKPENYSNKFYGPSTLRLGIEKSRNLMTVRLAQYIGMERVVDVADRFGIGKGMPATLSMAIGAWETTLLDLTTAYAELVNGGRRIEPTLIDRVQDRRGKTIYRHDTRPCVGCNADGWRYQKEPVIPDLRKQIIDPATAYQVVSMLQGVVERGTGRRAAAVGKPLGGKTGTTNDNRDSWFLGFSPDLAVGVYVGFDAPKSLGKRETGSSVAAPIFTDFMKAALADEPAVPFRIPPGIRLVRVNARTGLPAEPGDRNVILEAFKPGTEPDGPQQVIDQGAPDLLGAALTSGTGGLY